MVQYSLSSVGSFYIRFSNQNRSYFKFHGNKKSCWSNINYLDFEIIYLCSKKLFVTSDQFQLYQDEFVAIMCYSFLFFFKVCVLFILRRHSFKYNLMISNSKINRIAIMKIANKNRSEYSVLQWSHGATRTIYITQLRGSHKLGGETRINLY